MHPPFKYSYINKYPDLNTFNLTKKVVSLSNIYSLPDPFCASNLANAALRAFSLLSVNESAPPEFPLLDDLFQEPNSGILELFDCSVDPNTIPDPVNAAVDELLLPSFFSLPLPPII
jgi:hypothetical protein